METSRRDGSVRRHWLDLAAALAAVMFLGHVAAPVVSADVGPKPEMRFFFVFEQEGAPQVADGQLIECDDPACGDGKPLESVGPQHFTCNAQDCRSMAYGYAPYHRLEITFADGSRRQSNVFEKTAFAADFRVAVGKDHLQVSEVSMQKVFLCPALLTLVVEFFVALAFLSINRLPKLTLVWVLLGNVVTLPVVWYLFPAIGLPALVTTALAEAFAFLVEAGLLRILTRRPQLMWRQAVTLSLAMNVASFVFGLLIW